MQARIFLQRIVRIVAPILDRRMPQRGKATECKTLRKNSPAILALSQKGTCKILYYEMARKVWAVQSLGPS